MKNIFYFLGILVLLIFLFYPKYKKFKAKQHLQIVFNAHNQKNLCTKIISIESKDFLFYSGRKNDIGEVIKFSCVGKNNKLIKGEVQYHENYSNKDAYLSYTIY